MQDDRKLKLSGWELWNRIMAVVGTIATVTGTLVAIWALIFPADLNRLLESILERLEDRGTLSFEFGHTSPYPDRLWTNPMIVNSSERPMDQVSVRATASGGRSDQVFSIDLGLLRPTDGKNWVWEMPPGTDGIDYCVTFSDQGTRYWYAGISRVIYQDGRTVLTDVSVTEPSKSQPNQRSCRAPA